MAASKYIATLVVALAVSWATQAAARQPAVTETLPGPPALQPTAGFVVPMWSPGRPPTADRRVAFVSVPKLYGPGQIQLSNGTAIDSADLAAVAFGGAPDASCTLTLIGPKVVVLAAHCVDAGWPPDSGETEALAGQVRFGNQQPFNMTCKLSPAYKARKVDLSGGTRSPLDYALCELDRSVANVSPESISLAPVGSVPLTLMGFGCFNLRLTPAGLYEYEKDPATPKLRMASDDIDGRDVVTHVDQAGAYLRTLSTSTNEPVVCYGDSGGPVMMKTPDGVRRRVVAVNSGFGPTPDTSPTKQHFYSYFSPFSTAEFQAFLEKWAGPKGNVRLVVCGYNRDPGIGSCRE